MLRKTADKVSRRLEGGGWVLVGAFRRGEADNSLRITENIIADISASGVVILGNAHFIKTEFFLKAIGF